MNNDVSRAYLNQNKIQIPQGNKEAAEAAEVKAPVKRQDHFSAAECLDTMGRAQINMKKTTEDSVREFQEDPVAASAKIEFCDDLINKKGYDTIKAMNITDSVFRELKKKDTYGK